MMTFKLSKSNPDTDRIRQLVFLDEQRFKQEFNPLEDMQYTYISAYDQSKCIGIVRVKVQGEMGFIGRLALLRAYRQKGLGQQLMKQAEAHLRQMGAKEIHLHAQEAKIPFYEKCGYVAYGDFEMDEYMPHQWMKKEIV